MIEEKEIQVTVKQKEIVIYCNNCKKEIAKDLISEDEYYDDNEYSITSNDFCIKCSTEKYKYYRIEPKYEYCQQHLCPECRKNLSDKLDVALDGVKDIFREFNIKLNGD